MCLSVPQNHAREESYRLLQEHLGQLKEKPANRQEVLKLYQAIVVLQARQVLAGLLANWPSSGPKLSTTFLGNIDITQYFCLLDLLLKQQTPENCKKVSVNKATPCQSTTHFACPLASPRSYLLPSAQQRLQKWSVWQ